MTKEQSEAIEYFMDKIKDAIPRYTEMLIDGKIIKEEVYQIKMRFDQEDAEKMKTVLNMLKEKDAEIEKKDKIIDLYIDELVTNMFDRCCQECCRECEKDKDTLRNCIKQYFERIEKNERI
jgi:hypothetical protein